MKRANLAKMTVAELVERFTALALAQDESELWSQIAKLNRLLDQMEEVKAALKERDGDQRLALLPLHNHPNAQVRYKAATTTLPVAREASRRVLEIISVRNEFPQAANARGILEAMDEGRM